MSYPTPGYVLGHAMVGAPPDSEIAPRMIRGTVAKGQDDTGPDRRSFLPLSSLYSFFSFPSFVPRGYGWPRFWSVLLPSILIPFRTRDGCLPLSSCSRSPFVSSFFPLFPFPLSYIVPPVFRPRGGWLVTVLFSVVIPPILRSSLLFLSLLLPWPGEGWWWYCSLLSPVPSGDFPCLTCLSFFILSSGWFCSVLCPSFRLSFFLFLSFSLSFSLFPYLFLSSRGGWLVTVLFLLCRRLSFFPLSFVFSSFVLPREWW